MNTEQAFKTLWCEWVSSGHNDHEYLLHLFDRLKQQRGGYYGSTRLCIVLGIWSITALAPLSLFIAWSSGAYHEDNLNSVLAAAIAILTMFTVSCFGIGVVAGWLMPWRRVFSIVHASAVSALLTYFGIFLTAADEDYRGAIVALGILTILAAIFGGASIGLWAAVIFAGAYSLLPIFVLLRLWKQDDPNAALHMRWTCVWWRDELSYLQVEQALEQLGGFDVSKELKTLQRVEMRNEELDKALAELSSPEWPLRWRARQICLRFGGMAAKQLSLAEHDPSPSAGPYPYAKTLIGDISTDTTDRLRHGRYICPACCCDVARQRARRKRFYGCRRCGRSHHVLHASGRIVCILDRQSENKIDRVSDELHINWLLTRCLPDCERVRIGDVGDQDVEAFVVAIQNENDPKSRRRYAKMICTIDDGATLHENSLRMLRQTFRRVHMRPRPAQPAVAVVSAVSAVPAEEGSNGRL